MKGSSMFFLAFSSLIALVGLAAAAVAKGDDLFFFGLGLFGFGVLFALSVVKRYFDVVDASRP